MTVTTISGEITREVVLNNGTYGVSLTISKTGDIASFSKYGIFEPNTVTNANIVNSGKITGVYTGVYLGTGGTINNAGTIRGGEAGVIISHSTLLNSGYIFGGLLVGVADGYYGTVQNTGTIIGQTVGVALLAHSEFKNLGTIYGTLAGADQFGGYFNNSHLISGGTYGAFASGGDFVNGAAGTIAGTIEGVVIAPLTRANNASPINSTFINHGYVHGGLFGALMANTTVTVNGAALLQTAALYNDGTISGFLSGVTAADGSMNNSGLIESNEVGVILTAGTLIDSGTVSATIAVYGTNQISLYLSQGADFQGLVEDHSGDGNIFLTGTKKSSIDFGSSFTGFSNIDFVAGSTWSLEAGSIAIANGQTITGFTYGDTIVLDNFVVNPLDTTYVPGTGLELTDTLGNHVTLDITGNLSTASFLVIDPPTSTTIEIICYLRGTRIATPAGDVPVETLQIGDAVITRFNGYRKIKWIGRQSFGARFIGHNPDQIPVCITAGALGPNMPSRDLFVSPGHSMLIRDALILAKNLVNGVTILQTPPSEDVHYYQLEFESHDCVLAENAWSESYADTPGWRGQFHNADEFWRLFPEHIAPAAQTLCAPRPLAGPKLEAALRPLAARAAALTRPGRLHGFVDSVTDSNICGWAWDELNPHLPVLLDILVAGHVIGSPLACQPRADLRDAGYAQVQCGFSFTSPIGLPADPRHITIRRLSDGAIVSPINQIRAA